MLELEAIQSLMLEAVPFNRVLGVRVVAVAPERVELVLPEAPERLNHVGTVHAAAQFGLGEATAGTMVISAFSDLRDQGAVPLATEASIIYRKPSRGDLRGVATLSADEQARIRHEMATNGKARFTVAAQLFDREGTLTTEMRVEWALLPRRRES